MAGRKINLDVVRDIAMKLTDVEESTLHGAPSWKVRGRLLACPAIHRSAEPDTLAVRMDLAERAKLLAAAPEVYYVTEHYEGHPIVLVRLSQIGRYSLRDLLGKAWHFVSNKKKGGDRKASVRETGKNQKRRLVPRVGLEPTTN